MGPPDKWSAPPSRISTGPRRASPICTARSPEPAVAYLESHDQWLVGDKTFVFRLMDGAMYECMGKTRDEAPHPAVERGVALHKMARLPPRHGRRGVAHLHGQRVWPPGVGGFPARGNANRSSTPGAKESPRPGRPKLLLDLERFDAAPARG